VRRRTSRPRVLGRRVIEDILEIGQRLIAVKETCRHGEWLPWLPEEFHWGEDTARKYMLVAERFSDQIPTGSGFQIDAGALYHLARRSVPEPIRIQMIERAQAGEHITTRGASAPLFGAIWMSCCGLPD
jgi:hypothetical protein